MCDVRDSAEPIKALGVGSSHIVGNDIRVRQSGTHGCQVTIEFTVGVQDVLDPNASSQLNVAAPPIHHFEDRSVI